MNISENYKRLNAELHQNPEYGTSGWKTRNEVRQVSDWGRKAILDYGAGKCTLAKALGPAYSVTNYDPCIPGLETPPEPHPVVVCGDVLEHVEPDCLADVLADLRRLTTDCIFARMALSPSTQTLSDGRNAHLILESPEWWAEQFTKAGFVVEQVKPKERTKHTTWLVAH